MSKILALGYFFLIVALIAFVFIVPEIPAGIAGMAFLAAFLTTGYNKGQSSKGPTLLH